MILANVNSLDDLRGEDGEYLAGTVNVTGGVYLSGKGLERLPVKFGTVGGSFSCSANRLTSLEGAPSAVGRNFFCHANRLTSLVGVHKIIKRIGGTLNIWSNPIESGGISLVLVEGLTDVIFTDGSAFDIINRHLGQGMRGVLQCQEALHDAGYGEFAQL